MRRLSCIVNFYIINPLEATVLLQSSWNITKMFDVMYLPQIRIWVMSGQKLGHYVKFL